MHKHAHAHSWQVRITLTKSTEGWTFNSSKDTIWWDRLFSHDTRLNTFSLDRAVSSISDHLAVNRMPPLPHPPRPPGIVAFAQLPVQHDAPEDDMDAAEILQHHVTDLVLAYATAYRLHRARPERRPCAASALLRRLSHVLALRSGPGSATSSAATVDLWERAVDRELETIFDWQQRDMLRLVVLRDAEAILLDRATCEHALFGVHQVIRLPLCVTSRCLLTHACFFVTREHLY